MVGPHSLRHSGAHGGAHGVPGMALGVGVFFLAQQQFENHLLVPKLMERQVGVSAVTVIIALLDRRIAARHRRGAPGGADRGRAAGDLRRADRTTTG